MEIQWSLVLFTALTGLGGCLFFFICLDSLLNKAGKGALKGGAVALALLIVGGLASVTHLSHPDRMMGALQHPTSGIFTEAVLVGLLSLTCIIFLVMKQREIGGTSLKIVSVIGMVLGLLMSFMAGQSYIMSAIPAWDTELLPLGYLGTALAEGASAYLLLIGLEKSEEGIDFYGMMLGVCGAIALVTSLAYGAVSGALVNETVLPLVCAAIAFAGVVPGCCGIIARKTPAMVIPLGAIALIASLVGAIAYRCGMWLLGEGIYNFFGML